MNTLYRDLTVRGKEYNPKYPLGTYLRRWANMRGITQMTMAREIGYSEKYALWRARTVTLKNFFAIVEYLSKNSGLPEEFYCARLKQVIKGEYKWRN